MGAPGCPEFAFWTISAAKHRIVFTAVFESIPALAAALEGDNSFWRLAEGEPSCPWEDLVVVMAEGGILND